MYCSPRHCLADDAFNDAFKPARGFAHPIPLMDGAALSMNLPLPEVAPATDVSGLDVSALVRRAAAGDITAFERLYRLHDADGVAALYAPSARTRMGSRYLTPAEVHAHPREWPCRLER